MGKKRHGRKTGGSYERSEEANPGQQEPKADLGQGDFGEEDGNDSLWGSKTPIRTRKPPSGAEARWEAMIGQQLQTPERHRGSLVNWLASPAHIGSPCLFNSPEPVPLFQPSPKRHGLASPQQHSGVNSFGNIFASPVRGAAELQASDLLRFETPSSKPALGGLLSPSPRRSRRLASGGQQRKRAVSLEAAGWMPQLGANLGLLGRDGLDDAQPFAHNATDDDEGDLVKDLLQSPGPKEVQQLADGRVQTRSRGHMAPADAAAAAATGAAAAATGAAAADPVFKAAAHSRRRALDFSRAEAMQHDLQHALPVRRRSRHGSSSHAELDGAAAAAAVGQQHLEPLHPKFQPHLPLVPLDLSEVEKHNPEASASAAAAAGVACSTGVTPRRGRSARQQHALDATFTSPRSALDAAAAVVAGGAMEALQNSGLTLHMGALDPAELGALEALARPAFDALGSSRGLGVGAAAAAAGSGDAVSMMVPLGTVLPAAPGSQRQQQLAAAEYEDAGKSSGSSRGRRQQQQQQSHDDEDDYMVDVKDVEQQRQDDEEDDELPTAACHSRRRSAAAAAPGPAAAAAAAGGSRPWNLRPHGKKHILQELQPSRRSRRIARGIADDEDQQQQQQQLGAAAEDAEAPCSSGSRRRQQRRRQQQEETDDEQQEAGYGHMPHQQQQQEIKLEHLGAYEAVAAAAAAAEQAEAVEGPEQQQDLQQQDDEQHQHSDEQQQQQHKAGSSERPRSRSGGRRNRQGRKGSKGSRRQNADDTGDEDEDYCAGSAAEQQQQQPGLPAVTGLQQLMQSSGLQQVLQLPNGTLVPVPVTATPDKHSLAARLASSSGSAAAGTGLVGPGTPDEMRLAHVLAPTMPPMRTCHCKKSQCLKLYCDCFSAGTFCSGCACNDCRNTEANTQEVMARRLQIQQRDPTAFSHKLAPRPDSVALTNRKGCRCKKSHCLKKYCECYQMGVHCGEVCKCSDCHNVDYGGASTTSSGAVGTKQLLPRALHAQTRAGSNQQRLQHTAAVPQYWQLGQQPLTSGVSSGSGTPVAAAAAAAASAGFGAAAPTIMVRLPGGPHTPSSTQMLCLPFPGSQGQAISVLPLQAPSSISQGHSNPGLPSSMANTPNPPAKSAAMHSSEGACRTAKPLLPQFMKAAAAATAACSSGDAAAADAADPGKAQAAAAGTAGDDAAACLLSDEELPTPDQLAAGNAAGGHLVASPTTCVASNDAGSNAAAATGCTANLRLTSPQQQQPSSSAQQAAAAAATAAAQAAAPGARSPARHLSPGAGRQPSPAAAAAAAASSSSGGGGMGSPKAAAGLSSASSKGRHRLAATSRATDEPVQPLQQQQPYQQQGIYALTAGSVQPDVAAAAGSAAAAAGTAGHTSSTRRQLLVPVKEEDAGSNSCWSTQQLQAQQQLQQQMHLLAARSAMAAPPAVHWQRSSSSTVKAEAPAAAAAVAAAGALATPATAVPAADATEVGEHGSPVQHICLGPSGPIIPVPQRTLASAMQTVALCSHAATPGADSASDVSDTQTVGVLITVTNEQGVAQQYFLPVSSQTAAAAAAPGVNAADTAAVQAKDQQQQQQPHYQLRRRSVCSFQGTGVAQLSTAADAMAVDQQQEQAAAHGQQQPAAPTAASAAAAGGAACNGSAAGGGARTPGKARTTPVKRKADVEDQDQQPPGDEPSRCRLLRSPAKLQHQFDSPGQQHKHQQEEQEHSSPPKQQQPQVLVSPVKCTRNGSLVVLQQTCGPQQQQQLLRIPHVPVSWTHDAANTGSSSGFNSPIADGMSSVTTTFLQLAPQHAQQQQQHVAQPQSLQLPQGMQLFYATMPDGKQIPFMAPIGTDATQLLGGAASVQAGAMLPANEAHLQQQWAFDGEDGSMQQQQQQQQSQHPYLQQQPLGGAAGVSGLAAFQRQHSGSSGGGMSPAARQPDLFDNTSPVSYNKVLLSPSDARSSGGALFRFSPGCTTVFSPNKPKTSSSPC